MSDVRLGTTYESYWCFTRSGIANTGLAPQVLVFPEISGVPIYTGAMSGFVGFTGVYRAHIPVLAASGFVQGASYSLWATGVASGGYPVREFIGRLNVKLGLFDYLTGIADSVYHAQIDHCYRKPSGDNLWTVIWYKDGVPYPIWSTGRITVFDSGQNALFSNSGLTAYTSISGGKLTTGGSLVLKSGERYAVETTAFIDGATRKWVDHVGYDI